MALTMSLILPYLWGRTRPTTDTAVAIIFNEPNFSIPNHGPTAFVQTPQEMLDSAIIVFTGVVLDRATAPVFQPPLLLCFGRSDAVSWLCPGFSHRPFATIDSR